MYGGVRLQCEDVKLHATVYSVEVSGYRLQCGSVEVSGYRLHYSVAVYIFQYIYLSLVAFSRYHPIRHLVH